MLSNARQIHPIAFISRLFVNRHLHYVQGQSPCSKSREYFYYIDHQGQLFMDDARMKNFTSCFKEKAFLKFFFSRLQFNGSGRYPEFPYVSPCGHEVNYVRCDDIPVVFTHMTNDDRLSYSGAGDMLTLDFSPTELCMLPETGRVYHPGLPRLGNVGLIKSSLAIELSKNFDFETASNNQPTHLVWNGKRHLLTNNVVELLRKERERIEKLDGS